MDEFMEMRKLRAENEDLKQKVAHETNAKNEEVKKRKMTAKKFKELKNDVKRENKVLTDTMVRMDEEIINLEEQLKVSQERAKNIQFEGQLQVSEKQVTIIALQEQLRISRELAKELHLEEQINISQKQVKNVQFEGQLQVPEQEAKIIDFEEKLRVSREQAKHIHRQEELKVSNQQAKIIQLEKKLRASREEVNICGNESTNYLASFHDAARRVAATEQLQFQSDENKRLNEAVESLLKYKQNYRERSTNCTWIMEELDELERVTTHFSFRRRISTKRALINQLRDLIGRTLRMRYTQQDNAGNQGLRLRR